MAQKFVQKGENKLQQIRDVLTESGYDEGRSYAPQFMGSGQYTPFIFANSAKTMSSLNINPNTGIKVTPVTESNVSQFRIGDYTPKTNQQSGYNVVKNSPTDIVKNYVTSSARAMRSLSPTQITGAVAEGFVAGKTGLTSGDNLADTVARTAVGQVMRMNPLTGFAWGVANAGASIENAVKAIQDEYYNQDFNFELAGNFVKNADGTTTFVKDYKKMATAGSESGKGVLDALRTDNTSVSMDKDNMVNINVSPVFAESDNYKALLEVIRENYPNMTKEDFDKVVDNDTGLTLGKEIENLIKSAEVNYIYNAQMGAQIKETAPTASGDALNNAIDVSKIGYYSQDMLSKTQIKVFNEKNEVVEVNAKDYLDGIKNMSKLERNDYMNSLNNRISDANISDNEKAILYGQSIALYSASNNDGEYKGIFKKDFCDSVGDASFMGVRIGSIFGNRELDAFETDDFYASTFVLASTFANVGLLAKGTNLLEQGIRHIPGLSSLSNLEKALGGLGAASGKEVLTKEILAKALGAGAIDVGFQLSADAVYDLIKMGVWNLAGEGENFNYWDELASDAAFDFLMSYGPSQLVKSYEAPKLETRVAVDTGKGKIEYMRYKDAKQDIKDGKKYRIITDEQGIRDIKYVEVTAKELSQRRAEFVDKLSNNKATLKLYELFFDRNAAMSKLATQVLKATGDNYLFRKMLRYGGDIKQVTSSVKDEYFATNKEAKKHLDDFSNTLKEVAPKNRNFTKADAAYINAKANEYRFLQTAEREDDKKAISKFYSESINGVSKERARQLDILMNKMRAVASDMLNMYEKEGVLSSADAEKLRELPEYKGGMYLPVWTKNKINISGEVSQGRTAVKKIFDRDQLIDVKDLENPINTLAGYMDNAFRNVALNRRAETIKEAASVSGVNIRLTMDDAGGLTEVTNLKELDTKFRQRIYIIEGQVKKQFPDYDKWRAINEEFIEKSGVYNKIDDFTNKNNELSNYQNQIRNTKTRLKNAQKKGDISKITDESNKLNELNNKLENAKAEQMKLLDDIKNDITNKMMDIQKKSSQREVELDIKSYSDVQLTNEIKKAIKAQNANGELKNVFNRAIENANPFVDPQIIIDRRSQKAAEKYRKELNKEMKLKEKKDREKTSVDNIANKVMDYLTEKMYGRQNKIAVIDEEGVTRLLNNWDQEGTIRYMVDGKVQEMKLTGFGAESLAKEFYEPEYTFAKNGAIRGILHIGNSIAQAKRYLTTSADISRVMPNLFRDWSRGIVTTGGEILLSPDTIKNELIDKYGYNEEQIARINDGWELARQSVDRDTFTSSMEMPKKNRGKEMVRAANEPDGNGFVKFIYNIKTGQIGKALSTPQDMAESFTRKRAMDVAYYRELQKAQSKGYSLDDSIKRATESAYFYGKESTTNFARRGTIIAKIAQQVPYLSQRFASIESFKNAWMDNPIQVSRALHDVVSFGTIAIADILMSEDSRKKYYMLSEYDRSHNILISLGNGSIMTIPLDDTIAAFFTPYRRMVESMNGVDPEAFYMCFLEGLSDFSPLDISGFSEGDKFNLKRGLEVLGSEFIPTFLQPIIENIIGEDLYYGSKISVDADYIGQRTGNFTPTAGELTTTSKNSQLLANVSNGTGIPQWQLQNIISDYGGNIGQYVLNVIDKISGASEEAQGGKEWSDSVFKPFTGADSDNVTSKFYNIVNEMQVKKKETQNQIKTLNNKIEIATGSEKIELQKQRQDVINKYGLSISDTLNRFLTAYEITGGLPKDLSNQVWYLYRLYDSNENKDLYAEGSTGEYYSDKASSYASKQATGLAAASGIDGIIRAPVSDYNDTYAEQAFMNTIYGDPIPYISSIEKLMKNNNINRGNMYNGLYAATTSADKKKWKDEWNAKVVSALAPYVETVGIDTLLSQRKVVDFLDEYIFVSNPFKTKDYIKQIFGGR